MMLSILQIFIYCLEYEFIPTCVGEIMFLTLVMNHPHTSGLIVDAELCCNDFYDKSPHIWVNFLDFR